jgi:alpha-tubulin suppressor-like RCC1 family protein
MRRLAINIICVAVISSPFASVRANVLAAGFDHFCFATQPENVFCFGGNKYGQLGRGAASSSPLSSGAALLPRVRIVTLTAGQFATCVTREANEGALCWGSGALSGQTPYSDSDPYPVAPVSLGSGTTAEVISLGQSACAIVEGGLKCWGYNSLGQVGDGTTTKRLTPTVVPALPPNGPLTVTAVDLVESFGADSFTFGHACAVANGSVYCWGPNSEGQLGDGTTTQRLSPTAVAASAPGATAIATGLAHSCSVNSGAAFCWGDNAYGQLGNGTLQDSSVPVPVAGLQSGVTSIAAGVRHTCALQEGNVMCWGYNAGGQLGDGTTTTRTTPVSATAFALAATEVAVTANYSCATNFGLATGTGETRCWGLVPYHAPQQGESEPLDVIWSSGFEPPRPGWLP